MEVDVPAAQPGAVAGESRQAIGVDEDAAALHLGDEPDDSGQAPAGAGHDDDVVDSSDRRAAGIEQRQPHHAEGVDQLPGHPPEASCCDSVATPDRESAEPAERTSTRVSKKATPPPQSVSVSLVKALAARPSGCCVAHQPHGIGDDTGADSFADADGEHDGGAVIEDFGGVTLGEATGCGIGGGDLDERCALGGTVLGKRRVARIEEAGVMLGGDELEGIGSEQIAVTAGTLGGRVVRRQRRLADRLQRSN